MANPLDIPTDIPWRRICVSEDMLDPVPCGNEYPPRWRSSLAVFRYDPTDEYQPFDDHIISYIKVVATIAPFAPEIGVDIGGEYVPPELIDELEDAYPCYGSLLHVSVTPTEAEMGDFNASEFPYIAQFEPKKRELYETVTDTGEVLSGSSTSLKVGKSGVSSQTTENFNIDTGWNFGVSGKYKEYGGEIKAGETGKWGTSSANKYETTHTHNYDESLERKETQSHTTELSQMYNLLQGFHLGTNRALFFMEPHPHIRQSEETFVNGPRAMEGVQEFMLVVIRPEKMKDYCINATLETAHLLTEPVYHYETDSDVVNFRLTAKAQNKDTDWGKNSFTSEPVSHTETFYAPPGFEITGYNMNELASQRVHEGPTVTWNANMLTVYGSVTWRFWEGEFHAFEGYRDHYEDGILDVDVTVELRAKEGEVSEYTRQLFLSARQLCCCKRQIRPVKPSITFADALARDARIKLHHGFMDKKAFAQSRKFSYALRNQIIKSLGSSKRIPYGEQSFVESDVFMRKVVNVLKARRITRELFKPAAEASVISPKDREVISQKMESFSLADFLEEDATLIARRLKRNPNEILKLKANTLRSIAERATTKTEKATRRKK